MKVKFDECEVDDALVTYGVLQALTMHAARPMSDDYSGVSSQSMSEDYETGSDCTPIRVLQMT